jgi:hypothetical protein
MVTGLWTNDRDTLAAGIWGHDGLDATALAQQLIDRGVVRVLDPADTELRHRVAHALADEQLMRLTGAERSAYLREARAVIEALRQP